MKFTETLWRSSAAIGLAATLSGCDISIPNSQSSQPLVSVGTEVGSQNHTHHAKLRFISTLFGLEVYSVSVGADTTPGFPMQRWIGKDERYPNGSSRHWTCGNSGYPDEWKCDFIASP